MKLGDILFIALIVVLLWGPTRLGGLGKGIGEGIRNFRKGLRGSGGVPQDPQLPQLPQDAAVDRREGPKR